MRNKDDEIAKLKGENLELSINNNTISKELKDIKNQAIFLAHQERIAKLADNVEQPKLSVDNFSFPLFNKITEKLNIRKEIASIQVMNKVGNIISGFMQTKDLKKMNCINKKFREYYSNNKDMLKIICQKQADTNAKYKKMLVSLKEKISKLEIENSQQKKHLFMKYDDAKEEIKEYLVDFIWDTYEPGKKMKDWFNKSWNMLINYCRLSDIEDPIERMNKESNKNKIDETSASSNSGGGAFGILKQSINMIGSTFSGEVSQSKKVDGSDKSPQKESSKTQEENKNTKPQKSNGLFDAFWGGSKEIKEEPKKVKQGDNSSKPPTSKHKELPSKVQEGVDENPDDFFNKNLDNPDRGDRVTMATSNPSAFEMSNVSSIEVFSYYRENPKDLLKIFSQIGSKVASSKDGKSGKWIQDIIKNYVTLLLYSVTAFEEINKLNKIKEYFAIKIEKTIEEKKDCLKNIEALQEEVKYEHKKKDDALEESRKAKIMLVEKSAEFTVKMNELLHIKDEKEEAIKFAENLEKKHKETKKVIYFSKFSKKLL